MIGLVITILLVSLGLAVILGFAHPPKHWVEWCVLLIVSAGFGAYLGAKLWVFVAATQFFLGGRP